jgi:hypothetical protein
MSNIYPLGPLLVGPAGCIFTISRGRPETIGFLGASVAAGSVPSRAVARPTLKPWLGSGTVDGHDFFEPLQLYNQTLPKIM